MVGGVVTGASSGRHHNGLHQSLGEALGDLRLALGHQVLRPEVEVSETNWPIMTVSEWLSGLLKWQSRTLRNGTAVAT